MARWAPAKKDQLQALAEEILHNYGQGRSIIAVDGPSGAGTKQFADDLAEEFRRRGRSVFRAALDDFHRSRKERERDGWFSPRAFYDESFDYSLFRRILVDPFRTAGSTGFVLAGYDEERDQVIHQPKWITAGADALLIVDGLFLNRGDLAGLWNYSIWLTVSQDVALARITATGVDPTGELAQRGTGADALYQADADPSEKASAIIDNTDPDHPRRVFADSC
ncbi:uridine kinase [Parafrigoribacterium mesophilum]|uniref:uridine kinase n=1 Tax=Parafrigoribacterium mesophilum TaxID=433646 RepID=UPI0031FD8770